MTTPEHLLLRLRNIKRLLYQATYHHLAAQQVETMLAKFVAAPDEGELLTDIEQLVNRSNSPDTINSQRLHAMAVKWFHIATQEHTQQASGDQRV